MTSPLQDTLGRPLRKLRVSVTDRCNLRCSYCMPRSDYAWLPREHLLTFAEITRFVTVVARLGVARLRLTGGEPLVRKDLHALIGDLGAVDGIRSIAMTTNGLLLGENARQLRAAGLEGITVSVDSLRPERFAQLTKKNDLSDVLDGLDSARSEGFERIKTNTVVIRGFNDDELEAIVEFARARGLEPRFIEYMDVGGATDWRPEAVVPRAELLGRLAGTYGPIRQLLNRDGAPADRFELSDGFIIGVISSTSQPFCRGCDRARVTADGVLLNCLYAHGGLDVRALMRGGSDDAELTEHVAERWGLRDDRGAEKRLELAARGPSVRVDALAQDPHLEMHTRGG